MSTLILSGWTQPVDALAHIAEDAVFFDYSDYRTADEAIEALKKIKPARVIGWSMGGQLALRAIAAGALNPAHLTLIGVPLQFVGAEAMGEETFRLFRESYIADPARTKARFHGLIAKGDARMREIIELLGHHPEVENVQRWLPWLDDLAAHRLDVSALAKAPPALIIHGTRDHIVPHRQGELLAAALPNAMLETWQNAGHAPHLHDANRLKQAIAQHRQNNS